MAIFYEKTHQPQARQCPKAVSIPGLSTRWVLAFLWSSRNGIFRCSWKLAVPVLLDWLYYLKKIYKNYRLLLRQSRRSAVPTAFLLFFLASHLHLPRSPLRSQHCLFCRMCFIFLLNTNSHKIPMKKNHPSTHMEAVSARSPQTQLGVGKPCVAQN